MIKENTTMTTVEELSFSAILYDPETNLFPSAVPIKRMAIRGSVVDPLFLLCSEFECGAEYDNLLH